MSDFLIIYCVNFGILKDRFWVHFLQLDGEQRRVAVTDLGVDKMYIKMDRELMGVD
jgi:hypothetical protein